MSPLQWHPKSDGPHGWHHKSKWRPSSLATPGRQKTRWRGDFWWHQHPNWWDSSTTFGRFSIQTFLELYCLNVLISVNAWYLPVYDGSEALLRLTTIFIFLSNMGAMIPVSMSITIGERLIFIISKQLVLIVFYLFIYFQ